MKKALVLFTCVSTVICFNVTALASAAPVFTNQSAGTITPYYTSISRTAEQVYISGGKVIAYGEMATRQVTDLSIKITIQQKINGNWKARLTTSDSANDNFFYLEDSVSCGSGENYRVIIEYKAGTDSPKVTKLINT